MLSVLALCWLISAEVSRPEAAPDAVVIAPREFMQALQPLVEHRQRQGHRLAHIANGGSAAEIRAGLRKVAAGGALKYVLIVAMRTRQRGRIRQLRRGRCRRRWCGERECEMGQRAAIASDIGTQDLDGDHLPDVRWVEFRQIRWQMFREWWRRFWPMKKIAISGRGGSG